MQLQALSVGHCVDAGSAGLASVHSVFARAVNVEVRGDLWTLLGAERGDLAFGIRVASQDFEALGLRRGDRVHIRAGFVGIAAGAARLVVDCRAAPRWIPNPPQGTLAPGLRKRLRTVSAAASDRAWHGCAGMARAVVSALDEPDALADVLAKVLGRGPGSTPAGDDVLVGILAVLASPHSGAAGARAAQSLCCSMLPLLPTTTDISGHLLRQAAEGLFSRAVHELVCALIGDADPQRLRDTIQRAVETGATSGADACMGILACAPLFLPHDDRSAFLPDHERAAA